MKKINRAYSNPVKAAAVDRSQVSREDVDELVLTITNDGDLYRERITPAIENLKRKYKKGKYDRDLAVKLWQYVADEGVRRYDKEFGSGRGSVAMLSPATRKAIAEELRDYYEDEIMYEDDVQASTKRRGRKTIMGSKRYVKGSYDDAYTEDLGDFGMREIEELRDILDAWINNGLPDDFDFSGVKPAFNRHSGYVFLINDDYQVCMEVDGVLESFYTTPYSGYEGFYEDLLNEADSSWNYEDLEYLRDIAETKGDNEGFDQITALMAEDEEEY